MQKSIDFDLVSEFYDLYTDTDYDLKFWIDTIKNSPAPALELMCGTGRIIKPALEAGCVLEGLDYSQELLARCEYKLFKAGLKTALYGYDARDFSIKHQKYGLMFIAFQAIAEVCSDKEKKQLFECVHTHLLPEGLFYVSAHNPAQRKLTLDGQPKNFGTYPIGDGGQTVEISGIYALDEQNNIVTGTQFYKCFTNGQPDRQVEMPVKFHLISPDELENILKQAGFNISQKFGDYDKSPFTQQSPFCIFACSKK